MIERLHKIIEGWYIYENALFEVCLLHTLRENSAMACYIRSGQGLIEYNPEKLNTATDAQLESLLKIECVRLLLKHPYERQPADCSPLERLYASNLVIGDNYQLPGVDIPAPEDFDLPKGKSYEWYAYHLPKARGSESFSESGGDSTQESSNDLPQESGDDLAQASSEDRLQAAADAVALWQENSLLADSIGIAIEKVEKSERWGSLPNNLVQTIIANSKAVVDYRKVLSGFRSSILSSKRHLTRMRPNRRTGFANMGSIHSLSTRLLVAVDVSSSISDECLKVFMSVVNKAFKYGIERLDLITFDAVIHDIMPFKKAFDKITITGRGGTSFQPVIDYAQANKYDGVLIFTDGLALEPKMPEFPRFKLVWVFDSLDTYNKLRVFFEPFGRCFPIIS